MAEYNEPEDKAPMPFAVVEKMMPMYPIVAVMGWMIVLISFLIAFTQISSNLEDWFAQTKPVRESDASLVDTWTDIHVLETWVANFKFFGLGLGLMAIAMALGLIALRLRTMAYMVNTHLSPEKKIDIPPKPKIVRLMQGSAMMGIMILMITLILGFVFAFGQVSDYYGSGVQNPTLNGYSGSKLEDYGFIRSFGFWLNTLRMVGMGFLLLAITLALKVILGTLDLQNKELKKL
ncbi:MAG: hypothetical protein HeimC2_07120 [Candidatus Heimdallarchaeota archaeon LC_2]|nr:MAG: hypothetical protein HeimC2_07120 [Candidatus Heimdallarchaeota archaeon LC_2]